MQIQRRRTQRNVDLQCSGDLRVIPPVRKLPTGQGYICLRVDRSELALGAYMFLCVGYLLIDPMIVSSSLKGGNPRRNAVLCALFGSGQAAVLRSRFCCTCACTVRKMHSTKHTRASMRVRARPNSPRWARARRNIPPPNKCETN